MTATYQDSTPRRAQNKIWGKTGELSPERIEEMEQAKEYLYELTFVEDIPPEVAADMYYEKFPDVDPHPLRRSPWTENQIAWGKFNKDTQPARKLFNSLKAPHFYTLHAKDIGLDPYYEDAANFPLGSHDSTLKAIWRAKLKEIFSSNYFYKLEHCTRMHVHVIAEGDKLLHIPRDGELVKPVKPGTEVRLLGYLYKPHGTNTKENLAMWIHAKRKLGLEGKNLSPSCGYVGLESVENFNPSVLSKAVSREVEKTNTTIINNTRNKRRNKGKSDDDSYKWIPDQRAIPDEWLLSSGEYG